MATAIEPTTAHMEAGRSMERKPTVKQKVGHLRVDEQGGVSYKKTPSSTLMASLQLGLSHSIGKLEPKPRRDILMTDFDVVETVDFPSSGSEITQAHKNKDFTFTTYSPEAFRFFREAFQIKAEDYLLALCNQPMIELSNPGASGSLFYLSADDEFIIKTVQKKEAKFLQKLLPGYYLNLTQNKKTLLPKFFGLYQYRCGSTKIRIVVMNNLLPSSIKYHWRFDLKGSTYKRRASPKEREKESPTFKDIDYREIFPEGIFLLPDRFEILSRTLQRDCQVLESFGIMDYSLLLGVHRADESGNSGPPPPSPLEAPTDTSLLSPLSDDDSKRSPRRLKPVQSRIEARKNFSIMADEVLDPDIEPGEVPPTKYPDGYILARTDQGDKVLLYLGVIDILQSYKLKKKVEHGLKSLLTDGDTVSVHNPSFYSARFQTFMGSEVFKKEKVKIRPRRNSTPYKGANRKTIGSQRTPTKERVSRDSDVSRPPNSDPASPMHLQPLNLKQKETIKEDDIAIELNEDSVTKIQSGLLDDSGQVDKDLSSNSNTPIVSSAQVYVPGIGNSNSNGRGGADSNIPVIPQPVLPSLDTSTT